MKKTVQILFLLLISLLISCMNQEKEKQLADRLIGVQWENSDLDFIFFDSTLVHILMKDMYPETCAFEYLIKSDTLIIINKTVDAYNLFEFKDSISHLRIKYVEKDSIELEPLNDGAIELFNGFESYKFYNSKTIDRYTYYREKDASCLKQITKAKEEIENGLFVVCIHREWPFRQQKEFIEVLEKHNIGYKDLGPYPDVMPFERDCYKETMDYYIQKQFGDSFIDSLMRTADTLMVRNNRSKFIEYYACDEQPHLPNSRDGYNDNMTAEVDLPLRKFKKEWERSEGEYQFAVYRPFMDIGFHIDTTGEISNFYLNSFVPELDWNKKYKEELFKLGVEKLKEDSVWVPGKILGFKVRTDHNVRMYFEKVDE